MIKKVALTVEGLFRLNFYRGSGTILVTERCIQITIQVTAVVVGLRVELMLDFH
jgi:hypothetical protein